MRREEQGVMAATATWSLAEANCLIMVDEDVTAVSVGEEVLVSFLAQRG